MGWGWNGMARPSCGVLLQAASGGDGEAREGAEEDEKRKKRGEGGTGRCWRGRAVGSTRNL